MKTFLLIILGILVLIACTLGDYAEGCCGMPGKSQTPEKDMGAACLIGGPSLVLFFVVLCLM